MNTKLIALVEAQVTEQPQHRQREYMLSGQSVLLPDTRVDVRVDRRDAGDLGSFPSSVTPFALTAVVHAYPLEPGMSRPGRVRAAISDDEAEAWARVAFGHHLSDYAYQLRIDIPDRLRRQIPPHQKWFVVVVDEHGEPMLAPDNFRWGLIFYTRSRPRKLHAVNGSLCDQLASSGPYVDTTPFRDPRTDADGGWTVDVVGDTKSLTPVARDAVEAAHRIFRRRGAVTTDFQTKRLVVDGTTLQIHFRWKNNPNVFVISARIPQSDSDFIGPPGHNPSAWMSTVAQEYSEEFHTGYMVRTRRSRVGDVVHLGQPDRRGGSEYYLRGGADGPLSLHLQRCGQCVAHAVVVEEVDEIAVLERVESQADVPEAEIRWMVWVALNEAADTGARCVVTHLDMPLLEAMGFRPDGRGRFVFDVVSEM
ncbi:hypothetical protein DK926_05090 [Rhodococcus sp. Eu-32]|uniref:hypothetical protein n=1 Tax=Rhodococcus sp. Eu-32 TaxID=1017319 RepID=UPI000DF429B6|nr:hypothetical protein [Rhodococcus sp. Eu-32]RRQ29259.1 hypothetical protein DK926_05090 [Rhodococcus sp. Eu-32]